MINWAGLCLDINLQLNIQIISPQNTNYVYIMSPLLDLSQESKEIYCKGNVIKEDFKKKLKSCDAAVPFTL